MALLFPATGASIIQGPCGRTTVAQPCSHLQIPPVPLCATLQLGGDPPSPRGHPEHPWPLGPSYTGHPP